MRKAGNRTLSRCRARSGGVRVCRRPCSVAASRGGGWCGGDGGTDSEARPCGKVARPSLDGTTPPGRHRPLPQQWTPRETVYRRRPVRPSVHRRAVYATVVTATATAGDEEPIATVVFSTSYFIRSNTVVFFYTVSLPSFFFPGIRSSFRHEYRQCSPLYAATASPADTDRLFFGARQPFLYYVSGKPRVVLYMIYIFCP